MVLGRVVLGILLNFALRNLLDLFRPLFRQLHQLIAVVNLLLLVLVCILAQAVGIRLGHIHHDRNVLQIGIPHIILFVNVYLVLIRISSVYSEQFFLLLDQLLLDLESLPVPLEESPLVLRRPVSPSVGVVAIILHFVGNEVFMILQVTNFVVLVTHFLGLEEMRFVIATLVEELNCSALFASLDVFDQLLQIDQLVVLVHWTSEPLFFLETLLGPSFVLPLDLVLVRSFKLEFVRGKSRSFGVGV